MADIIQADYTQLQSIAQQFSNSQQNIQMLNQRLNQHIEQLRGHGWIGAGAQSFYTEMDTVLLPSIKRLSEALNLAEATTRHIISEFQAAEEDAKSLLGGEMADDGNASPDAGKFNYSYKDAALLKDGTRTGDDHRTADIFYINGINTDANGHLGSIDVIREEFPGKSVAGIYNQTDGAEDDFVQAVGDRYGDANNNQAVNSLASAMKDRLQNGGSFEIIAHSQGAAITAQALRQLAAENVDMSRVKVTTLGGFGINFPPGVEVHHYVHLGDPVGAASVVEDPNVAHKTTVMPDWERTGKLLQGDLSLSNLVAHDGDNYIRNMGEFRRVEASSNRQETIKDIERERFNDSINDFVSDTKENINNLISLGERYF
jgi:WXG100 family type VII secretion target